MDYLYLIAAILAGVATSIPLAVKLVSFVKQAIHEKNWKPVLDLAMKYMEEAEKKIEANADRKEYVMAMVKVSAESCGYEYDAAVISEMIDSMCTMARTVNGPKEEKEKEAA